MTETAIEAPHGVRAAFKLPVPVDVPGSWIFEAEWQGRGIATLKIFDPDGTMLAKRVGTSPQGFALDVLGQPDPARPYVFSFETPLARGALAGVLRVKTPAAPRPEPPPSKASLSVADDQPRFDASAWRGPGRCLAPALADDAAGRALVRLGTSLESAAAKRRAWAATWGERIAQLADQENGDGSLSRRQLDRLWKEIGDDGADADADEVGRSMRGVLAAIEDLVRREETSNDARWAELRSRRREVLSTMACLSGPAGGR